MTFQVEFLTVSFVRITTPRCAVSTRVSLHANDMDMTLRLGLGYPDGPIALLNRSGLHHHFEVTQDLYEQLGQEAYAPARRARNAWLKQNLLIEDDDAAA